MYAENARRQGVILAFYVGSSPTVSTLYVYVDIPVGSVFAGNGALVSFIKMLARQRKAKCFLMQCIADLVRRQIPQIDGDSQKHCFPLFPDIA